MLKHILLTCKSDKVKRLASETYSDFNKRNELRIVRLFKPCNIKAYNANIGNCVPIHTYFNNIEEYIKTACTVKEYVLNRVQIPKHITTHRGLYAVYMDDWIDQGQGMDITHRVYQKEITELIKVIHTYGLTSTLCGHYIRDTRHIFQQSRYWNICINHFKDLEWRKNTKRR